MKKNITNGIFIALTGLILTAPSALLLLPQFRAADTSASENRTLTAFPEWKTPEGSRNPDFFPQAESWFTEHFALRTQLVNAYSNLTRKVFSVSSNPDVIIGKDGWLYYAETVPDITGSRTLNDIEIRHMAQSLCMMRDYAQANCAQFIFAAAPDKGSIYPDNLPPRYLQTGQQNNLDTLYDALKDTGVTVCDWRSALRENAQNRQLYHKLDTHWNGDGAMLAYQTLMQTAGLDDHGFAACQRTETHDWNGDLWGMLSPNKENPDDNAVYAVPETYRTVGRMRSIDDMNIRTTCADGTESLLMFRDSFGRALIPLLSQRFSACSYSRATAVPLDTIAAAPTDVVVYEVVERNLKNLLTYAPVMPAPPAELNQPDALNGDIAKFRVNFENDGVYLHCYGLYDETLEDCDSIICTFRSGNFSQSFNAFPCCEAEKLGLDAPAANGYSLRVPLGELPPQGVLSVRVVQQNEAHLVGMADYSTAQEAVPQVDTTGEINE